MFVELHPGCSGQSEGRPMREKIEEWKIEIREFNWISYLPYYTLRD
jgi:hypothetical protein